VFADNRIDLLRASINKPARLFWFDDIRLIATILVNEKDYIIGVVGVEQLDEDQLREELEKLGIHPKP
jgi:hypothetical protein